MVKSIHYLSVACALACGGLAACQQNTGPAPGLVFRELARWDISVPRHYGGDGSLSPGNFDTTAGPELAVVCTERGRNRIQLPDVSDPKQRETFICGLDGTRRGFDFGQRKGKVHIGGHFGPAPLAWDADGDGVSELLAYDPSYPPGAINLGGGGAPPPTHDPSASPGTLRFHGIRVFSAAGGPELMTLNFADNGQVAVADVDGDGQRELLGVSGKQWHAFKPTAVRLQIPTLWERVDMRLRTAAEQRYAEAQTIGRCPAASASRAWGDIDGDGRAEYLEWDGQGLAAHGIDGRRVPAPGWPAGVPTNGLTCLDIDGDGRDEAVAPRAGFLNFATGKFTPLAAPPAGLGAARDDKLVCGNFRGQRELVWLPSQPAQARQAGANPYGTTLHYFGADGQPLGQQSLDRQIYDMCVVEVAGQDHLAVLASGRVYISP